MWTPCERGFNEERREWQAMLERNSRREDCNDEERRQVQARLGQEARLEYEERRIKHELRI